MFINFMPSKGGAPAPYEMVINNNITASKASVPQNELLTVSVQMRNNSSFEAFPGGQAGVALVNNSGNIVEVIGVINYGALNARSTRTSTTNAFVPETVQAGTYKLRIATKVEGENWKLVERSAVGNGIPNAINLTVTAGAANGGGYGMALTALTTDKTLISKGDTTKFNAGAGFRNISQDTYAGGDWGIALVDNANAIVPLGWRSLNKRDPGANIGVGSVSCTVPSTVQSGTYKLRMIIRQTGGEWRIATLSIDGIPNSIDFTVQ
jgi:hypothetical protein